MQDTPFEENPLDAAEALLEDGKAGQAAALLTPLVEQNRGGLAARLLLARAFAAAGEGHQAVALARETAGLYPTLAEAALGYGAALLEAENLPDAIGELQRALRLDSENHEARFLLGCAWLEAGEPDQALNAFSCLSDDDVPDVSSKIAEAEAMQARPRSDAGYVRHLFDQFSADYDTRMLGQLGYRAPQTLRELAHFVIPGQTGLAVLDLGCGTGLSGAAFRDRADHLTGLDLSPAMLEKARARGVYDALILGDIESGLGTGLYDLVIAADTLVYLGDLEDAMRAVALSLKADGFFLFTTEAQEGGEDDNGFSLGPKRRWRHSEVYLRALAARHGFAIAGFMACEPRHEAGIPVPGFAVALSKTAG